MVHINKNAGLAVKLFFHATKIETEVWLGTNSNTGEEILWQKPSKGRISRHGGRNITKIAKELDEILNSGEAECLYKNDILLDQLAKHIR